MQYQEALDYLYQQLPMFSRVGAAAYKKDIDNTIALCKALGDPQNKFKSIHIAGTNGKGSTSHMLAAMLQQQGYKTGLYTSPHIHDFGERIRINGQMINRQFVIEFTLKTQELCRNIQPSFFELTVAMAFCYFAEQQVDIAVIETGLGGRLDSTNIIQPILSVITNIGLDHTNLLGDTLEQIAFEKAGIIKPHTPVVIGTTHEITAAVFVQRALECNATIAFADQLYEISDEIQSNSYLQCKVTDLTNHHIEDFQLDLTGTYQLQNLKTVLAAEKWLHQLGFMIDEPNEKKALMQVKQLTGLSGRWDVVQQKPYEIHDVGHNQNGIQEILNQLNNQYPLSRIHFVLGFVKDKDISSVLKLMPANANYYFTNAHIPRALPHTELKTIAAEFQLKGESYDDVNEAIAAAKRNVGIEDVIMVCGSFFILSEIKK